MRYQRNDTTTINAALGDTIVAHRHRHCHRDGVRLRVCATPDPDAHDTMRLAAALIAGVDERSFTAGLNEIEEG